MERRCVRQGCKLKLTLGGLSIIWIDGGFAAAHDATQGLDFFPLLYTPMDRREPQPQPLCLFPTVNAGLVAFLWTFSSHPTYPIKS